MPNNTQWQCRYSPTLGALEDTPQNIWGTSDYVDIGKPTIFMGIYSLNDFYVLWKHKGRKAILWCGSDLKRLKDGYWLDKIGEIRMNTKLLAEWINKNC